MKMTDGLTKPNVKALKDELSKLYEDFHRDLPAGESPQEVNELRQMAAHATSSMLTLSLYRRSLEEYIRKREAQVILAHNVAKDVPTPKDQSMQAFINEELAEEKSYFHQLESMIDIAKTRTLLIMSLLKSLGESRYV